MLVTFFVGAPVSAETGPPGVNGREGKTCDETAAVQPQAASTLSLGNVQLFAWDRLPEPQLIQYDQNGYPLVSDTAAALLLLRQELVQGCHRLPFQQRPLAPAVLLHQLYTIVNNRTKVDREIHRLREERKVRVYDSGTGTDQQLVVLMTDITFQVDHGVREKDGSFGADLVLSLVNEVIHFYFPLPHNLLVLSNPPTLPPPHTFVSPLFQLHQIQVNRTSVPIEDMKRLLSEILLRLGSQHAPSGDTDVLKARAPLLIFSYPSVSPKKNLTPETFFKLRILH